MAKLFRPKKLIHLNFDINDVQETSDSATTLTWQLNTASPQILSEHARIVLDNLYIKKTATTDVVYLYTNDVDTSLTFDSKGKGIYGAVLFNVSKDASTVQYHNYNPKISKNWKCKENLLSGNQNFRINLTNITKVDIEQLYFTLIVYDEELELQEDTGPWSSQQLISNKSSNPNWIK